MGIFGFGSKETLFFPGCFSEAFFPNKIENYQKILKKLKIPFWKTSSMACCGGILDESGYEKQMRKLSRENSEYLERKEVKKIITICPKCQITLGDYNSIVPNWQIESEFILITILNAIKQNPELVKNYFREDICYYDSCYLGRKLKIIEEPRELLKIMGYNIIELPYEKEDTLCCGSCGVLDITNKDLSEKLVLDFFKMLKRRNIKKIITADLFAYKLLKDSQQKFQINDLEIFEFSEMICNALGIKPVEQEN